MNEMKYLVEIMHIHHRTFLSIKFVMIVSIAVLSSVLVLFAKLPIPTEVCFSYYIGCFIFVAILDFSILYETIYKIKIYIIKITEASCLKKKKSKIFVKFIFNF